MGFGGVIIYCIPPPPNSIPHCHEEPKTKWSDNDEGRARSHGRLWKGDLCHLSVVSCPPTPAHLSTFLKRVALFWGSKPWTIDTAGSEESGEKWASVYGIFLQRKKIKEV
ncbi:uncharacterized protein V6R79_014137 [Siganus canaliculatus]